jgi:hypothetical protein
MEEKSSTMNDSSVASSSGVTKVTESDSTKKDREKRKKQLEPYSIESDTKAAAKKRLSAMNKFKKICLKVFLPILKEKPVASTFTPLGYLQPNDRDELFGAVQDLVKLEDYQCPDCLMDFVEAEFAVDSFMEDFYNRMFDTLHGDKDYFTGKLTKWTKDKQYRFYENLIEGIFVDREKLIYDAYSDWLEEHTCDSGIDESDESDESED